MLAKEAVREFQKIYLQEFGHQISYEEAQQVAANLLRFYKFTMPNANKKVRDGQKDS